MSCNYLIEYTSFGLIPEWTPPTQQNVGDDSNTPYIRFRPRSPIQNLRCHVVSAPHHITKPFACHHDMVRREGQNLLKLDDTRLKKFFVTMRRPFPKLVLHISK
jgi:hypothetical protein